MALIEKVANEYNLSPDLISAIIREESRFNKKAVSSAGARGLMQVMPRDGISAAFMCKNGPCFANRPTTQELQDPEFNVSYGAKLLSNLNIYHGSMREALRAYGPMDAGYSYADKVLGVYRQHSSTVE